MKKCSPLILVLVICSINYTQAQRPFASHPNHTHQSPVTDAAYSEDFIYYAQQLFDWHEVYKAFCDRLKIDLTECTYFFKYALDKNLIDGEDYLSKVKSGAINESNAQAYWLKQLPAIEKIYRKELKIITSLQKQATSSIIVSNTRTRASCNNLDFANGTTSNWIAKWCSKNSGFAGSNYNLTAATLPDVGFNSSGLNLYGYVHELVTDDAPDMYCGIKKVPPGHTYALRLGDDKAQSGGFMGKPNNHQMVSNTFVVDPNKPCITYWYAVVFSQASGGKKPHDQKDQPYFKIRVYDENNNEIKCGTYDVDATKGSTNGFTIKDIDGRVEAVYKDWVPIYIPLIDYKGKKVTVQFESSDCQQGGHFGYAYLAVDCSPFKVITAKPGDCTNPTMELSAPDGAGAYVWSGPGVIPPNNVKTIKINKSGQYTVEMSVIANDGVICKFKLDTTINISNGSMDVKFTNTTVCIGNATQFTDVSNPKPTSWSWDFDGDGKEDSKAQNPTYTFTSPGTFAVTLNVMVGTCPGKITQNVIVGPPLNLVITNPAPVCSPFTVDITAATITAGSDVGVLTYWQDAACTDPVTDPTKIKDVGVYYIKSTSSTGCTNIKPVEVKINPGPLLVITDPEPVCLGVVDITLPSTTAGSDSLGTLTYWADASATIPLTSPNAIAITGVYYIKLTTPAGCASIKSVRVNILPNPTLIITDPTPECAPNTVDITDKQITNGSIGLAFLTYWLDSACTKPLSNPDYLTASGIYYIKTGVNACSDKKPVNVTVYPAPIVDGGPDLFLCTGSSDTLGTIAIAGYTYLWTPATGLSKPTSARTKVSLINTSNSTQTTVYTLTVTDIKTGCTSTDQVNVAIGALTSANAGSPQTVCMGVPIQLEGHIGGSATMGTWSGGAGTYIPNNNDLNASYTPTLAEYVAGSVTLLLTTDDPFGPCDASISQVTFNFYPMPLVNFSVDKKEGCPVHCVKFTDSTIVIGSLDKPAKWQWDFGDGGMSSTQNPSHCYTNPGYYDVSLTATSIQGCVSKLTKLKMIYVYPQPIAEFSINPNPASTIDPKVMLKNFSSADAITWNYDFGDGYKTGPAIQNPEHDYEKVEKIYLASLIVTNKEGCVDTVQHEVIVGPEFIFYIPSAFTPNDNGINEYFYGKGYGIKDYDLRVFDRWGNMIFHGQDLNDKWDGTLKGTLCQQDVYVWKVLIKDVFNIKHQYTGTVTLIK